MSKNIYNAYKLWRKLLRNPYCSFNRYKFFFTLALTQERMSCPPWLKNNNDENY